MPPSISHDGVPIPGIPLFGQGIAHRATLDRVPRRTVSHLLLLRQVSIPGWKFPKGLGGHTVQDSNVGYG